MHEVHFWECRASWKRYTAGRTPRARRVTLVFWKYFITLLIFICNPVGGFNIVPKMVWYSKYMPLSCSTLGLTSIPLIFSAEGNNTLLLKPPSHQSFWQEQHEFLTREGNHFHNLFELGILQSLCGFWGMAKTISNDEVQTGNQGPTQPGSCKIYSNLGVPLVNSPKQRDNFIVTYNVKYPTSLSHSQKALLRQAFRSQFEYGWTTTASIIK